MPDIENNRKHFLQLIDFYLGFHKVDLFELGNDAIRGSIEGGGYRDLRPWSCECAGILSPDEEMEWHVSHIKMCLASSDEIQSFYEQFCVLVERENKAFRGKKEEVVGRFKTKAQEKGLKFWEICKKNVTSKLKTKKQFANSV